MNRLLTPQELSNILQIKLSTIYKWVHYGYIPCIKIGDLIRFKEKKVEEWLKRRERKGRQRYRVDV